MLISKKRMSELLEKNHINDENGFCVELRDGGMDKEIISYSVVVSGILYICMFSDGEIYFGGNDTYPAISNLASDIVLENGNNKTKIDVIVSYVFESGKVEVKNDLDLEKIKNKKK